MTILFLGGTGNLSADCAHLLVARRHTVYVPTRGRTPVPKGLRAVVADRRHPPELRAALAAVRADVVLNFLGFEPADVQLDFELLHGRLRQYVFISSATVYAKPHRQLPLTEAAPLGNEYWPYAQKKLACEQWLLERWRQDAFPVTIVRPSHTYSHRWVPNPISSASFTFAARLEHGRPVFLPDDGQSLWTLTAASDFAVGLAGLVGNEAALGEAVHITSDEALSWNRIVAEIADVLGAKSPPVVHIPTDFLCQVAPELTGPLKGDKANSAVFDNAKLKRLVPEFVCRKPFRTGVRESVAWLRAHPEQQNLKPEIDALCERVVAAWQRGRSAP
jgi:nucleoside-diphosphate-sugar epimerase